MKRDPVDHAVAYTDDLANLATKQELEEKSRIADEIKRRLDSLTPISLREPRTAYEMLQRQNRIVSVVNALIPEQQ